MRTLSLFPYPGGKFFLMKDIKEIFEKSGKTTAVDVFGGSGKFLLNVSAKNKVYNDLDSRLVNLYLVLRERHQELLDKFNYTIYSRELFARFVLEGISPDPLEDAFRYLYILFASFSAKGESFGYRIRGSKDPTRFVDNLTLKINSLHDQIRHWTIEHLDFRELLKKYDSEDTFFYMDPPYHNIEWYNYNFTDGDFMDLAEMMKTTRSRYLLNINEDKFIVDLFGEPCGTKDFANMCGLAKGTRRTRRKELFYWN
jgi:DNA adenine methylase